MGKCTCSSRRCARAAASSRQATGWRKRWCAGCAAVEGSETVRMGLQRKMCEGCGLEQPSYGLPPERRKRWCAGCRKGHPGAVHARQWASSRKRPAGKAIGATSGTSASATETHRAGESLPHATRAFMQGPQRVSCVAHEPPSKRRRVVVAGQLALPSAPAIDRHPLAGLLLQPLIDMWALRGEAVVPIISCRCRGARKPSWRRWSRPRSRRGGENEVDTDGPPSETTEAHEEDEDDWL